VSVVRWQLEEMATSTVHTVEVNPNQMSGYLPDKSFTFSSRVDAAGRVAGVRGKTRPAGFTFEGVIFTETHHDALLEWAGKAGKIRITDHLGRVFEVMTQGVKLVERKPTPLRAWRFTYVFDCMLLRRIS